MSKMNGTGAAGWAFAKRPFLSAMNRRTLALVAFALCAAALPRTGQARVVALVVESRQPFVGGVSWGTAGAYERLLGTAFMEVDPRDPLNALIVDLDRAPKNSRGMVEFSTRFFILKPVDMMRSNHKIYYTTNNRGNDALIAASTVAQVGSNDLYLRLGYTIADAGWEGDVVQTPVNLAANVPTARQPDGSPIVGVMRVEYSDRNLPQAGTFTLPLEGSANFRSYETADTNPSHSTLTVRDDVGTPKTAVSPDRWAFGKCPAGRTSLVPGTFDICFFDGFRADKIYELIYPAKNPLVMGLGHATTRDFASFLRYESADESGKANPLGPGIRRIYATGASQTGGYLRDFIYLGFNEDESHRQVFDGVLPTIAGTDRVFINVRFADPNVYSAQEDRHDFLQTSYPPTTYGVATDPVSGFRDGIMKRPTDPLVMQTDSELELWQLRGSLNVADGAGKPVSLPDNVRLYFNSSTAHGMRVTGLRTALAGSSVLCENPTPGGAVVETARALLVAMDAWADRGIEPPPSNYPSLEDGTLIPREAAAARFPAIPGVRFPTVAKRAAAGRLWSLVRSARGHPYDSSSFARWNLPAIRAEVRPRRPEHCRRAAHANPGSARNEHRLERSRSRPSGAEPLRADRLLFRVRANQGRATRHWRPARVSRGALPGPRGIRSRRRKSSARARQRALPSARGRRRVRRSRTDQQRPGRCALARR